MDKFDSLEKALTWIVVGLLCIGAYLYFDKRRTDSFNQFLLEQWCDRVLRAMFVNDDDIGFPSMIEKRNVVAASMYFEQQGAKTIIDTTDNRLVVAHRGRRCSLLITDVEM